VKISRILVATALLIHGLGGQAMEKTAYDRNGNEVIDLVEYARYVLDLHSPPLSHFDENLDGRIEGVEQERAAAALQELEASVSPCVDDFSVDYPDGQPLKDFTAQSVTCQLRGEDFFEGDFPERFTVRASTEDLILFRPKSGDVRRGAMFSLARDFNHSVRIASVKGAIIRPVNLVDPGEDKDAVRYLLPSLSINLMSDESGKNKNVDTMTFRLAYETGFSTEFLDWIRLGASPIWTTDTDLDLGILGADVQLEPTLLGSGMNVARRFGPLRVRWRGFLQSEYGEVRSTDDRPQLEQGDYSARGGGKLAMRLWPDQVFPSGIGKRLIFDVEYLQLWEFAGNLGDRDYFEASLSYLLDPAGHFRLQTKYVNGDATQALENEESWTIGLGVLY
jgi:hypothetical protein